MKETTLSRRIQMQEWNAGERAIYDATQAVESLGAHPLLTQAVNLLADARSRVADWQDGYQEPTCSYSHTPGVVDCAQLMPDPDWERQVKISHLLTWRSSVGDALVGDDIDAKLRELLL